ADLDLGTRIAQHAEHHGAASDLQLVPRSAQLAQPDFGIRRQPRHVGVIELDLGARTRSRRDPVIRNEGRVYSRGGVVTGVTTLNADLAVDNTDTGNTALAVTIVGAGDCQ